MPGGAVEVSLPLHCTIIFTTVLVELYTNPITCSKLRAPCILNGCCTAIAELHRLADLKVGELGHGIGESWQ